MDTQKLTLAQKVAYLELDLLKLRQENAALRKALPENSRHARRVEKAYEDALLLAGWRSAGIIPSRRYAKQDGFSQNRWQNALALLKLARVVTGQRHWAITELATIEHNLAIAKAKAVEDPSLFFCVCQVTISGWGKHNQDWLRFCAIVKPTRCVLIGEEGV